MIAGYLWLLFGWLVVSPDLDHRPTGALSETLYDLGQDVGRAGIAIAVSVAAYLLGSISQELSELLRRSVTSLLPFRTPELHTDRVAPLQALGRKAELILNTTQGRNVAKDSERITELGQRYDDALHGVGRELELPATLLVGEQAELFTEVDRLRAEGELRLAVVPPLLALTILAGWLASPFWVLATFPITLLLFQGIQRDADAKKIIADAMTMGRIQSSSVARFEEWVTGLPEEIKIRDQTAV